MKEIMTKEQIQKEIAEMDAYLPVSKIEERLGMPPTTLQKVLKGTRPLPKKWYKILEAYFIKPAKEEKEVSQIEEPEEVTQENTENDTIPETPKGESNLEKILRESREKIESQTKK